MITCTTTETLDREVGSVRVNEEAHPASAIADFGILVGGGVVKEVMDLLGGVGRGFRLFG